MNLDEAMKQLLLGKCVGRYTVPGMKLKIVSKEECPGLSDEELDKLKGTAIVDLSLINEDKKVGSWKITYSEMNAEDYYIYSDTENLTSEKAYEEIMKGNKVYNDILWPGGFYLAKYKDENGEEGPALFYPDGQIVYLYSTPWWVPKDYIEFENHYYIKE